MSQFPNPETQFKKGKSGNPGGFTKEQVDLRKANRDKAIALESRLLDALSNDMDENEARIIEHIRADVLKLIQNAVEREDGRPVARVENTSPDGSMTPQTVRIVAVSSEDDGS